METCDNIAVHKQHSNPVPTSIALFFSGFIYPTILLNQSNYFSVFCSNLKAFKVAEFETVFPGVPFLTELIKKGICQLLDNNTTGIPFIISEQPSLLEN